MQAKILLMALALLGLGGWSGTSALADDIHTHELDNGLRVVVLENHRAPVVVNQIWYRVGSVDEYRGVTGVSHALEHMMFKGTDDLESGEFSRRVARHGGRDNAFTSRDFTGYHQTIAADRLPMLLTMEADRMTDLILLEEEFLPEMRVVQEERRERVDDRPQSLLWERIRATAFPSSPARLPIIGWQSDLEHMVIDDLQDWYDRWYGPNNAVLVVAGAVTADEVFALAEDAFGDIAAIDLPRRLPIEEIDPDGEHRLELHAPARVPYLGMAWRLPSLTTLDEPDDAWALSVLAGVLDAGRSGRIDRRVVREQQIATSAGAGYSPFGRGDTLFTVAGTPAGDHSIDDLETALRGEIERLRAEPVDDDELERVRTRTRASQVFALDSVSGRARRVARLESLGLGHETWDQYLEGIAGVTAADIQRVAQEYLTAERLTVGVLVPDGMPTPGREGPGQEGPGQEGAAPAGGEDDVDP